MKTFNEWYRLIHFARNRADGDFSYLWCGERWTMTLGWAGVKRTYSDASVRSIGRTN